MTSSLVIPPKNRSITTEVSHHIQNIKFPDDTPHFNRQRLPQTGGIGLLWTPTESSCQVPCMSSGRVTTAVISLDLDQTRKCNSVVRQNQDLLTALQHNAEEELISFSLYHTALLLRFGVIGCSQIFRVVVMMSGDVIDVCFVEMQVSARKLACFYWGLLLRQCKLSLKLKQSTWISADFDNVRILTMENFKTTQTVMFPVKQLHTFQWPLLR